MQPEIISVGESLVEIMRPAAGQPLDRSGAFAGPFASGAPAIFAVAAARLGMRTGFASRVGDDAFGRLLRNRLERQGVDTTHMAAAPGYTTGVAFVAYDEEGRREFVFHLRQSAAALGVKDLLTAESFQGVRWLHISGSALFLSQASAESCTRALSLTKAAGGKLSLDPNLRPELMAFDEARGALAPYLEAADLLLPTAEEARVLTGQRSDELAAEALLDGKERVVALKRGATGCSVWSASGGLDLPGFHAPEVDPTGAGDCFNAAFIYGLEQGWSLARSGRFANAAGALAVTQLGPMEGAPTVEQVTSLLESGNV